MVVEVETVFFQCTRAIQRSRPWQLSLPELLAQVPSAGTIFSDLADSAIDGELPERHRRGRVATTLQASRCSWGR